MQLKKRAVAPREATRGEEQVLSIIWRESDCSTTISDPLLGGTGMRIDSVKVAGFRSIMNTSLDACGQLNVLIGKNNSGKSNLLIAIKRFFEYFTPEGRVATLSPDMRQPNDWYLKNVKSSIFISVTLALDDAERDELRESIVAETPQVRNALAGAELSNLVTVKLEFLPPPLVVGYVSSIRFGGAVSTDDGVILSVNRESAVEMAQASQSLDEFTEELQFLETVLSDFDEEDWRRIKERGYIPQSARLSRITGSNAQGSENLTKSVRASSSFSEFGASCRERTQYLATHIEQINSTPFENPISTFSGSATSVPEYVTSFLRKISGMNVHVLSEQRSPIGQVEASRILKLKTSRGQGEVLSAIQSVVSGLLGVQIDAFSADDPQLVRRMPALRRNEVTPAELDVDDFLVQLNGSGIREALRLILDREFERPDVLLVEEPEVHLHPALEIALMQYLKEVSDDCQIFLTTHSTNFLDTGSLKNIYLIRKSRETSVQHMDVNEAESAIPEELGLRLSSLFMFDRLAFVEGPSDEQMLRIFASTLGVSFGQASLGFVTTGGARNFTHYATTATLSFLKRGTFAPSLLLTGMSVMLPTLKHCTRRSMASAK